MKISQLCMVKLWFECFEYYPYIQMWQYMLICGVGAKPVAHLMQYHLLQWEVAKVKSLTRLGQLGANISPDRSSLMPQVLIGNFLCKPFVVCHKSWEKLYELQHINLLSLYLPKEDGVSPDAEYITEQRIFSIFLQ